ncbi:MAG: diguanylate cyclase [Lachnospiraceae bacterium]|nr:diguanylate cyclase [Lachnospiraceae bacterium]
MKKIQPKTVVSIVLMALVLLALFHSAFTRIRSLYSNQLYENALDLRRGFLSDTVNNLLLDIDSERANRIEEYQEIVSSVQDYVEEITKDSANVSEEVKTYLSGRTDKALWTYMAYDEKTNDIIYDSAGFLGDVWNGDVSSLDNAFVASGSIKKDGVVVIYGITKDTLKDNVQKNIIKKMHTNEFSSGVLWVNEIRNYDGGKNYAARVVDTEKPKQEGMLLSSTVTDANGKAYLESELDGINDSGEVYYTYDMKGEDGSVITRLTYGKLYPDYNWIVCMGVNLSDIVKFADASREEADKLLFRFEIIIAVYIILLVVFLAWAMLKADRSYTQSNEKKLQKQVEWDELTKANTRAFGMEKLEDIFKNYKKGKPSPAIMILDVDHFKEINDTYGHDAGDAVLRRVVTCLYHAIRRSDYLIRWGGDEFIGVFMNMKREVLERDFADKILKAVRSVEVILPDDVVVNVTASVGFAYFAPSDQNAMDGLKRADLALYESKEGGRDQAHIAPDGANIDNVPSR